MYLLVCTCACMRVCVRESVFVCTYVRVRVYGVVCVRLLFFRCETEREFALPSEKEKVCGPSCRSMPVSKAVSCALPPAPRCAKRLSHLAGVHVVFVVEVVVAVVVVVHIVRIQEEYT
jgi:hypothetical protein